MKEKSPNRAAPYFGPGAGVDTGEIFRQVDKYVAPGLMASQGGRRFHVMIKPAGAACNLACTYCFYLSKASLPGGPAPARMSDKVLTEFIRQYLERDVRRHYLLLFETLVAQHMGYPAQICVYSEFCGKGMALENDGSLYSCDHYVYPEYCLGNIMETQLGEMAFLRPQVKFGYAKHEALPSQCSQCPFLRDCWGECPKNRLIRTADGEPGLNYLCRGFKQFFAHAIPEVDRIVKHMQRQPSPLHRLM